MSLQRSEQTRDEGREREREKAETEAINDRQERNASVLLAPIMSNQPAHKAFRQTEFSSAIISKANI